MTEPMFSDILDDIYSLSPDLPLKSLKNLHGLVLRILLQIQHKEMLPRVLSIQEHSVFDPSDLTFAVMLGIHDELLRAFLEGLL